jgi:predicted MFS family arabinose efflux permease
MADIGNDPGLWAANALGAVAGAAVSLVYMLPRSRQEAVSRFLTGTTCGLIFGAPAGVWIVGRLGIAGEVSGNEMLLTGSAAASLCAWWVLGAAARIAARFGKGGG